MKLRQFLDLVVDRDFDSEVKVIGRGLGICEIIFIDICDSCQYPIYRPDDSVTHRNTIHLIIEPVKNLMSDTQET